MGEAKHTSGPWKAHISDTGAFSIEAEGGVGGFGMTLCQRSDWEHRADESAANGRLMAASPDLLAALQRTLSWLTSYQSSAAMGNGGPYEQARAAIAKAEGRTP